jgi:hypothetical protein
MGSRLDLRAEGVEVPLGGGRRDAQADRGRTRTPAAERRGRAVLGPLAVAKLARAGGGAAM